MSVPKSRRGESPAEYINLAREIYVFTYNRVRILPKSYTFYFSLPLYNAAREAYRMIKTANLIYVDEKSPEEIRRAGISSGGKSITRRHRAIITRCSTCSTSRI